MHPKRPPGRASVRLQLGVHLDEVCSWKMLCYCRERSP